jgi:hypothetical protein
VKIEYSFTPEFQEISLHFTLRHAGFRYSLFRRSFHPKNSTQPAFPGSLNRVWHAIFGLARSGCICSVPSDILLSLADLVSAGRKN